MYKRSVSLIGFLAGTPGAYCSGQNEVVSTFKPPKQAHKHLSHRVPTRPVPGLVSWHDAATWAVPGQVACRQALAPTWLERKDRRCFSPRTAPTWL